MTRLVKCVEVFDLIVDSGVFVVVNCRVCLGWLEREWSAVGFAREVKNVAAVRSLDKVPGVVPIPCP